MNKLLQYVINIKKKNEISLDKISYVQSLKSGVSFTLRAPVSSDGHILST